MPFSYKSHTPNFGIGYMEMPRSPQFTYKRGSGFSATRRLHCNWSDATIFAQELLGVVEFVAGVPNYSAAMSLPGMQFLVVDQIDIEPFDPDSPDGNTDLTLGTSAATYEGVGALVTAQYKAVDMNQDQNRPDIPSGTYLSIRETQATEYQTLPGRTWVWSSNGKPLPDDISAGLIIPTGQIIYTWSQVAQPPDNTIAAARGKVNNKTFGIYPAGQLLFMGVNKTRQFQFGDSNSGLYEIEFTFSVNGKGWNSFYDPVRGDWFEIKSTVGGNPPYASTSFDALFGYNG